jgi:hypothetical protein
MPETPEAMVGNVPLKRELGGADPRGHGVELQREF